MFTRLTGTAASALSVAINRTSTEPILWSGYLPPHLGRKRKRFTARAVSLEVLFSGARHGQGQRSSSRKHWRGHSSRRPDTVWIVHSMYKYVRHKAAARSDEPPDPRSHRWECFLSRSRARSVSRPSHPKAQVHPDLDHGALGRVAAPRETRTAQRDPASGAALEQGIPKS
jgi:hypothetical protein